MAHSDDDGLVLPPKLGSHPCGHRSYFQKMTRSYRKFPKRQKQLQQISERQGFSVKYDKRDTHKPGFKFAEYELKRRSCSNRDRGHADLENGTVEVARRDTKTKQFDELDRSDCQYSGSYWMRFKKNIYQKAF